MRISWRTEIVSWTALAFMAALLAINWSSAPEPYPVHWDIAGNVDRYGSKAEGLLALPAIAVAVYVALLFLPRLDPGRANYARFSGSYALIRTAVLVMLAAVYVTSVLSATGAPVNIPFAIGSTVGVLLILFGAVMGKVRPNWFVGVRTPWTLSSERSWTKTHRLGGWLFIGMGLAFGASAFTRSGLLVYAALAFTLVSIVWLFVYSYLVWRTDPDRVPPAGVVPFEERG